MRTQAVLAELASLRVEAASLRLQNAELLSENSRLRGAALASLRVGGGGGADGEGEEVALEPSWLDEAVARQMETLLADKAALAAEARCGCVQCGYAVQQNCV